MPYSESYDAALKKNHTWKLAGEAMGHKWKRFCNARLTRFQKVTGDLDLWFSGLHYQVGISASVLCTHCLGTNVGFLLPLPHNDAIKTNA